MSHSCDDTCTCDCKWCAASRRLPQTFTDLHAFLDLARYGDHLSVTVANGDGTLTARIEGPVLAADADPAVGIDLLDGAPYVLRKARGIVWAPVRRATLSRDGQAIATYTEADS